MDKKFELIKVFSTKLIPEDILIDMQKYFLEDENWIFGHNTAHEMISWETDSRDVTTRLNTWLLENGAEKNEDILIELYW